MIRVAASASFFEYFEMEWVSAFLAAHPLVQIDFVLSDITADLIADRIDVAFRIGSLPDSSYVARRIFASYGGLLASPAYLAAHGAPADLEELSNGVAWSRSVSAASDPVAGRRCRHIPLVSASLG